MRGILRVVLGAILVAASAFGTWPSAVGQTIPVGVARVDITPEFPVRLTGYASRLTESEGVAERIWAKALAIGADGGEGPAVLLMVENCGVPAAMADEVGARLGAKARVKRERLAVCSTHTHTGPWLNGFLPLHSLESLPAEHLRHIERYSAQLTDKMEQAALAALAARGPARLGWAQGTVTFAMNRRPVDGGRSTGMRANPEGTVDHSLPLLCARDEQGKLVALVVNYACHCTTLTGKHNEIHGDWAGAAQRMIEAEHAGATALVVIGCGADANPEPRGEMPMTEQHGRAVADEVNRLLAGKLEPVSAELTARMARIKLPLDNLPTREEFQARVEAGKDPKASGMAKRQAGHAAAMLAQMDRGTLPREIDYLVSVWAFGNDLAMVFLPGEVVSDFALRLKRELDGRRLWISAYTNGVPCYIVSRRILAEGGYEADSSMIGYGLPGPLAVSVEDQVIGTVKALVPPGFAKPAARAAKAAAKAAPCPWKAGVATVKITPEKMIWMAGYAARTKPAEGVAQDLFAKALALEDESGRRVVIVTVDLLGIRRSMRDAIEAAVCEKFGVKPNELLLNFSHTHSGPEFREGSYHELTDDERAYAESFREKIVGVVGQALAAMAPARLDYLRARCGFAMNRRLVTETEVRGAPNPDGPVDHDVPVLRVSDSSGAMRAVLFGYACHNTCLGLYKFCGDYAGYAQEYLEKDHPGVTALFMIGCGGDQNPYPRRTEELCHTHGRTLATAVAAALETAPRALAGPLRAAFAEVTLDFAPVPPKEELEKIAATKKRPDARHAQRLLAELAEKGKIRSTYSYPIQVVRFGDDLILVGLAGEVVVDYSLRLKRELAGPAVWVAGYTNDVFGYVPSLRVLKEGGYEGGGAMIWGSLPGPFTETIEERIIAKVHELARQP